MKITATYANVLGALRILLSKGSHHCHHINNDYYEDLYVPEYDSQEVKMLFTQHDLYYEGIPLTHLVSGIWY